MEKEMKNPYVTIKLSHLSSSSYIKGKNPYITGPKSLLRLSHDRV